jgi:hypothetical protein
MLKEKAAKLTFSHSQTLCQFRDARGIAVKSAFCNECQPTGNRI